MIVKDIYGDIRFKIRRNSPSDKLVIDEMFKQNVYHLRDDMFAEGDTILDIGANIGTFTIDVLRRAKNNGVSVTIYAIEPEPHNIRLLEKNIDQNSHLLEDSKVIIISKAIGGHEGKVFISDGHGGSRVTTEGTKVDIITLDRLIDLYSIKSIAFMKLDIEGSEVPTILNASDRAIDMMLRTAIEFDEQNDVADFTRILDRFARRCSFYTLGVPSRGCYLYTERHI